MLSLPHPQLLVLIILAQAGPSSSCQYLHSFGWARSLATKACFAYSNSRAELPGNSCSPGAVLSQWLMGVDVQISQFLQRLGQITLRHVFYPRSQISQMTQQCTLDWLPSFLCLTSSPHNCHFLWFSSKGLALKSLTWDLLPWEPILRQNVCWMNEGASVLVPAPHSPHHSWCMEPDSRQPCRIRARKSKHLAGNFKPSFLSPVTCVIKTHTQEHYFT